MQTYRYRWTLANGQSFEEGPKFSESNDAAVRRAQVRFQRAQTGPGDKMKVILVEPSGESWISTFTHNGLTFLAPAAASKTPED